MSVPRVVVCLLIGTQYLYARRRRASLVASRGKATQMARVHASVLPLAFLSLPCLFLVAGCGQEERQGAAVRVEDEWSAFCEAILQASRNNDVDGLMQLSWTDLADIERVLGPEVRKDKRAKSQGALDRAVRRDIEVFLRSYGDLFRCPPARFVAHLWGIDGELQIVGLPYGPLDRESLKPRSVIIWVRKGNRFRGIMVHTVGKIRSRLRVISWSGDEGHPTEPGAALWRKRAILESGSLESCGHPSEVSHEYEFRAHGKGDFRAGRGLRLVEISQPIDSPSDLLKLAAIVGGTGIVLFLFANLIMKATGDSIDAHARESRRYRDMGPLQQMTAFFSNPRNIPVAFGMVGIMLAFGGVCMAIGSLVWSLAPK